MNCHAIGALEENLRSRTISGLIYIEMPNQVTFSGGPHITGVIVVDKR